METPGKKETKNSVTGVENMEYDFRTIEKKWQQNWKESGAYKVSNDSKRQNIMYWTCFHIQAEQGCMSASAGIYSQRHLRKI
jgi:hypothetical protein